MRFIAHRGYSAKYYQNSEEAFIKAGEENFFFGVETDVRLTKDKVWVCCHDDNPFRNNSLRVSKVNIDVALSSELKKSKKGMAKWNGPVYLCTYKRYLEINAKYGMTPIIELKCKDIDDDSIKNLVELADKICAGKVIYIGYSGKDLLRIKAIRPNAKVQVLCKSPYGGNKYLNMGLDIDHMAFTFSPSLLKKARKLNREVNVWTIRSLIGAKIFVKLGVDYITTDYSYKNKLKSRLD